ncbi:MAG TPA: YceK/YidQ family lipoprotein [Planctomycetota bacterium]|nr:YceK/YidQ family lipoprotein [Planctomycetota bacterium]
MKRCLPAVALACLMGGCGSIADITTEQKIYGGIQQDVYLMKNPYLPKSEPPNYFFPLIIVGILDVPLSFALDTVLLPVTITIAATSSEPSRYEPFR